MKREVIVPEKTNSVSVDHVVPLKIYATKRRESVYKLQRVNDLWMFCSCTGSDCGHSGGHTSMADAIRAVKQNGDTCWQFDTQEEFFKWALEKNP